MTRLPKEQERRLLSKYLCGDFGAGKWITIKSLIVNGYVEAENIPCRVDDPDAFITGDGKTYKKSQTGSSEAEIRIMDGIVHESELVLSEKGIAYCDEHHANIIGLNGERL